MGYWSFKLPRVTLWRFFAIVTVLTLIASHAHTVRQFYVEDARLNELHRRFGVARVIDRNEPAARMVALSWTDWRIHIIQPEQKRYRLCGSTADVDQWNRDFPDPEFTIDMPRAREAWLNVSLAAEAPATTVRLELRSQQETIARRVFVPEHHYLDQLTHGGAQQDRYTVDSHARWYPIKPWHEQRAPHLLLALFKHQYSRSGRTPPGVEGLILWLEEIPPGTHEGD
jgi:hypothetical protein